MGKMVAKIAEVGLVVLAFSILVFNVTIWCNTATARGYMFTVRVGESTMSKFSGNVAGTYLLFSYPILLLAIVATMYLAIKQRYPSSLSTTRYGRVWRLLWTRPLFVNETMGVLNGIEIVVVAVTMFVMFWLFFEEYVPQARMFDGKPQATLLKWRQAAIVLGRVSALPISLLFLPVSRSSPILRMVDVPFEQAVWYHRWLGHLSMAIISWHAGIFIGIFAYKHHMMHLFDWPHSGISILAGLIAFVAGLVMWLTALPWVRRHFFIHFYRFHQLYWIFFAFFVYHVGVKTAGYAMGGIFLYFVDRFFRFYQSRRKMFISSAKILPNDVLELKIPTSSNLKYNAMSFLFINIPSISSSEWHPFSMASSPLDKQKNITIYIKPCGITRWTQHLHTLVDRSIKDHHLHTLIDRSIKDHRLHTLIDRSIKDASSTKSTHCPFSTKFSIEGPYGHESDYFLRYETLILIAGGIGITPFLAMISDILHRYNLGEKDHPRTIYLIWSVRSCEDLHLLQQLSPSSIFPGILAGVLCTINVHIYVTRNAWTRKILGKSSSMSIINKRTSKPIVVSAIGHNLWMSALIILTTISSTAIFGFFQVFIVETTKFGYRTKLPQWMHVTFFFVSMVVGVFVMGGIVMACWNAYLDHKEGNGNTNEVTNTNYDIEFGTQNTLYDYITTKNIGRLNSGEIFKKLKDARCLDGYVGVLVSGPESLQLDVAKECQSHSFKDLSQGQIFNYHSVSFSL